MAITYDWSVDLGDPNSTITLQYHAVPPGSLVLDVGCATGFMGQALVGHKACTYVGLELEEEQAALARARGIDVLTGDITNAEDRARVLDHAGRPFDVIVLGDVLEHLYNPFSALPAVVAELLDRGGLIVTSIPNVSHGSLRLDLLRGRFNYTETGLLDRTHVQLFTRARVGELYDVAGLQMMTDQRSYFPVFGTEGRVQQGELPAEIERFVLADTESFTYQFIGTGRPALTASRMQDPGAATRTWPGIVELVVLPVGPVSPTWVQALNLAVPDRFTLRLVDPVSEIGQATEALAEIDPATVVLVVDADCVPTASWVAPLLEAHRRHGGLVGGLRVTAEGVVRAAGCDETGRVAAVGSDSANPLLGGDRLDAYLTLPFVSTAAEVAPTPRGRLIAAAHAIVPGAASVAEIASWSDVVQPVTLVIGRESPQRLSEELQHQLMEAAAAPGTVVYRWASDGLEHSREHARHFAAEGLVLIGGTPDEQRASSVFRATAAALAKFLDAGRVVWLDSELAGAEVVTVGLMQPAAERVGVGAFVANVDVVASVGSLDLRPVAAHHQSQEPERVQPVSCVPGRVSVVLPMYGLGALTLEAIRCIERTTGHLDVEVVVVDNGSPDDAADIIANGAPEVVLVRNEQNQGFARGSNAGIRATTGEYVCILNNDTEPLDGWLDELLAALARPGVLMVGPRSDEISGIQRLEETPRLAEDPDAARAAGLAHAQQQVGRVFPLARLVGFCLLAKRETFERLGGFAVPHALGNFEDDELSVRILAAGGSLLVADGSVVLHHGSATFKQLSADFADQMLRAARSLDRPVPRGALRCVVLADGDAGAARRSVASAMAVADDIVVLAETQADEIRLAVADLGAVRVVQGFEAPTGGSPRELVIIAGELVAVSSPVAARTELFEAEGPMALTTRSGPQLRLVPGGRLDLVGSPGDAEILEHIRLE